MLAPERRPTSSNLMWQILIEWQTKLSWFPSPLDRPWKRRKGNEKETEWKEKWVRVLGPRGQMQLRTRRDQSFHFTKSRAAAFNYIWELVNLPSPVREGSSSHLRGKQSSLADNKQLCQWQQCSDIKPIDTTSWQVHTLSAEWEFSNVFCLLQMWTDVWSKKMTLL